MKKYRHTYRKASMAGAMCSDGDTLAFQKLKDVSRKRRQLANLGGRSGGWGDLSVGEQSWVTVIWEEKTAVDTFLTRCQHLASLTWPCSRQHRFTQDLIQSPQSRGVMEQAKCCCLNRGVFLSIRYIHMIKIFLRVYQRKYNR